MSKLENKVEKEYMQKGNSSDTLLVIYILRILKKYSSRENPLSAKDVFNHLQNDNFILCNENEEESQKKKIRRYLDTFCESYGKGCVRKNKGRRADGYTWYYDPSLDEFANEEGQPYETLSNEEIELLIDIIASSKIINTESTNEIINKLLKKTNFSDEEKARKFKEIKKEVWPKSINKELVNLRDKLQSCIYEYRKIQFDYKDKKSILATPYGWDADSNGKYILMAQVEGESKLRSFLLEEIQNLKELDIDWGLDEDVYYNVKCRKTDNEISLDNLFLNIGKIKDAIKNNVGIEFKYLSYVVKNEKVVVEEKSKSILPHSLVFTDGKYYLIGYDPNAEDRDKKIVYYRVDLMSQLNSFKPNQKLSDWDKGKFDEIVRSRMVEMHPLMLSGRETPVTFKVVESALDRVIDAFAKKPNELIVTNETRVVKDSSATGGHEERLVKVDVKISKEEAFRWALANADVVEVTSQEIRDKIARIADPVYQLYTQTLPDKVRENIDNVIKKGTFKISSKVDEYTAYTTYKELSKRRQLDVVDNIGIVGEDICDLGDYIGDFINAERLYISAPKCKNIPWASRLINIKTLELPQTPIDDTSWMNEMKKLRFLYLAESSVSDLSVLSEHQDIDYLDISDTNVSDIAFINNYQKLTYLNIVGCPIDDYSPIFITKSRLKCLEIDENALEKIGMEKIREYHIGIDIKVRNNSPFWRFLI